MHRQLMLSVYILFSLSIISVAHAEFSDGVDALNKGDYAKAYKEFKAAADGNFSYPSCHQRGNNQWHRSLPYASAG